MGRPVMTAWAAALLLWAGIGAEAKGPVPLPGHALVQPPDFTELAKFWHLTGTVMPSQKSIYLTPGVPDRIGTMFHRFPLTTNDFEVSFTFSAKSAFNAITDDGFAFWLSEENSSEQIFEPSQQHTHNQDKLISGTWRYEYINDGLGLLGYKNKFQGLGVFFLNGENQAKTVSVKVNDGSMDPQVGNGIPDQNQISFDYQKGVDHTVKIRVEPEKVTIGLYGPRGREGNLEVTTKVKQASYMGFSCFAGSKTDDPKVRSATVELKGMQVTNFAQGPGEEPPDKIPEPVAVPQEDNVLQQHSSFKDFRDEGETIKHLSNLVFKIVADSKPQRERMMTSIEALTTRMVSVESTFSSLKNRIEEEKGGDGSLGDEFERIKQELAAIHKDYHQDTAARGKKLEEVHSNIDAAHKSASMADGISSHLDTLSDTNEETLDQLTSGHKRTFGVSIAAIAFIIVAGLSLYNKFRCWEKRHCL